MKTKLAFYGKNKAATIHRIALWLLNKMKSLLQKIEMNYGFFVPPVEGLAPPADGLAAVASGSGPK